MMVAMRGSCFPWDRQMNMRRWIYGAFLALLFLTGGGVYVYEMLWNDFSSLNHYEALGVAPTATTLEIKRAFRELSLRYHPDKASSEINTKRFHRISEAAQVLSDEESRRTYDIQLHEEQRMRAYQDDLAWRKIRIAPSSYAFADLVKFYVTEFPWHVLRLLIQLMSIRLFFKALVVLGGVIFVFDLLSRFAGWMWRRVVPGPQCTAVPKEHKDEALRAARARQQKILEERSAVHQARLRQRKAEQIVATIASSQ